MSLGQNYTIRPADSASEFDGGDAIQSTIEDKTSHSVGAERLVNTEAPSFSNELPAHSTGNHDSASTCAGTVIITS